MSKLKSVIAAVRKNEDLDKKDQLTLYGLWMNAGGTPGLVRGILTILQDLKDSLPFGGDREVQSELQSDISTLTKVLDNLKYL